MLHLHAHEDGALFPEPPRNEHLPHSNAAHHISTNADSPLQRFVGGSTSAAENGMFGSRPPPVAASTCQRYSLAWLAASHCPGVTPHASVTRQAMVLRACCSQPVLSGP